MSGIAGIFARDGRPVAADELTPTLERLAHRGPDGSGQWQQGPVAFGHQTLWNTPEAVHEPMPFVLEEGPFAITADARIDNRDELIRGLGLTERPSRTIGDSELILRAYQRWGAACSEHLVGDFAFAIWDGPRQQVFCARDHMGAKPLLYYLSPAFFAFASEARPLLQHPAVPARINEGRVADYFVTALQTGDGRQTFFEEIVKLPAAHQLTVGREGARLERYWAPDPERELHLESDGAYEEAFRALLAEAVACRQRSYRGVGIGLSGGIDSASIAAIARARREDGAEIHTFSAIDPTDATCPDTRSIRAIVETGGLRARLLTPDHLSETWRSIPALVAGADTPFEGITSGVGPTIVAHAQRGGFGVLLDGLDGDALMGTGEIIVADLLRRGQWRRAVREARAFGAAYGTSTARMFWQYGVRAAAGFTFPRTTQRLRARYKRTRDVDQALAESLIDPDFAKRVGLEERLAEARARQHVYPMTSLRARHTNWLLHPNLSTAFEQGDHAASRYGLEGRSPLMDIRLLTFALALPPSQKMRGGQRKWLLRRAVEPWLPHEVLVRSGFERNVAPVFWKRLLTHEADYLRAFVADPGPAAPYIDVDKTRAAFAQYERDGFDASDVISVVAAATLATWITTHAESI